MNSSKKILATAGFVGLAALAVPGLANATPVSAVPASASSSWLRDVGSAPSAPSMYDDCTADQEGTVVTGADGGPLECVQSDAGYDWETPT